MSITPNCDHRFGPEGAQQPSQKGAASFALFSRMATVRQWIVWRVGMQREDIPQKDGALQLFNHGPDHGRSSLADRRSLRGPRQLRRSEKRGVRGEVNVVGESEACATPTAVTEVAGDPEGLYTAFYRCCENDRQIATANGRGICAVVAITRVRVRVENSFEFQCGNVPDKVINVVIIVRHADLLIRSQGDFEELSPDFLKEPCPVGSNERRGTANSHKHDTRGRNLHDLRTGTEGGKIPR